MWAVLKAQKLYTFIEKDFSKKIEMISNFTHQN